MTGGGPVVLNLDAVLARARSPGNEALPVFAHGSLEVEMYAPQGSDPQQPHARDEIYIVARGDGLFFDGTSRHAVRMGSFIFVPAGQQHRFERFSTDFAVWVFFYGPEIQTAPSSILPTSLPAVP